MTQIHTARRRRTRATRSKLEQALRLLESFAGADDVHDVISEDELRDLIAARRTIANIESTLYQRGI